MLSGAATPSHRILAPAGAAAPVVFDSPHSGFTFPPDFLPAAPRAALQTTWDAYVDELFAAAPAAGAPLVCADFPRAYIDANRAADDLDPALLAGPWPGPAAATDYSRRGMGLIRRLALPGVPMYDHPLPVAAVQHRLDAHYHPYRQALRTLLDQARARHGRVYHVNCHSMKSRGNAMNVDAGGARPDFVISDRRGATAAAGVLAWTVAYFASRGYRVQANDPYQGGNLVATFGRPAEHCHSIQVEINRALYLDEARFTRGRGWAPLRALLGEFAAALVAAAERWPAGGPS